LTHIKVGRQGIDQVALSPFASNPMAMAAIATFTANPAIDVSTSVGKVMPIRKLQCAAACRLPGGGGINVARVVKRLGGDVTAIYPVGGTSGELLCRLVDREKVASITVEIAEETRQNLTVLDEASGRPYRFVLPGPALTEAEWRRCLNAFSLIDWKPDFMVASGSLPPGVSDEAYAELARLAKKRGSKMILDVAGVPLAAALKEGVYLVKPNIRELQELAGEPLSHEAEWIRAARKLVDGGQAALVALTLGQHGALVATADGIFRASAPDVKPVSAIGMGDSFLGAMAWSLAEGMNVPEALRYAVAGGSAALLSPGTELCHADDVRRLHAQVSVWLV
jgi:6-phosphofructokinase 2